MTRSFAVAHLDELERLPVDEEGLVWRPLRRHFGIEAFGANVYTAEHAGERVVEEHSERTNEHQELYFVARGHATFTLDGDEVDAPAGTFVFVQPETRRGAIAREDGTTVLAVGGRVGEPFTVSGWESSFAAFAYHRAGDSERALATMRDGVASRPSDWAGHYNHACLLSLTGDREDALAALSRAVELSDEAAELARGDDDFTALRGDPEFESVVAGQAETGGEGP